MRTQQAVGAPQPHWFAACCGHPHSQSSLAQWGASAAMQVVSRRRSEVRVPWLHHLATAQEEEHDEQTDSEGAETEEEEESETEEGFSEVRGHGAPGPSVTPPRAARARSAVTWDVGPGYHMSHLVPNAQQWPSLIEPNKQGKASLGLFCTNPRPHC